MTPEEFEMFMRKIEVEFAGDKELAHLHADGLMCRVLRELKYDGGVNIFEEMGKWYA